MSVNAIDLSTLLKVLTQRIAKSGLIGAGWLGGEYVSKWKQARKEAIRREGQQKLQLLDIFPLNFFWKLGQKLHIVLWGASLGTKFAIGCWALTVWALITRVYLGLDWLFNAVANKPGKFIFFTWKILLVVNWVRGFDTLVRPSAQISKSLVAFFALDPLYRNVSVMEGPSDALECPHIIRVGRYVSATLELEADLAEIEGEFVESIFQSWLFLAFVWIDMHRHYESLDCLVMNIFDLAQLHVGGYEIFFVGCIINLRQLD